jgi:hypothetical protein
MGLFICLKKPAYKNDLHNEIETELIDAYGYNIFSLEEFKRILNLILKAKDSSGATFCKKFDSTGKSQGINTAMIAGHSMGGDTILILSNKDSIEEIQNADDIQAILIFNYEENDDDEESIKKYEIDIFILCSNQITNSGGGKILLQSLIDVSRRKGMRTISLVASETAVNYYKKFGFRLDSDLHDFMTLQLGGRKGLKRKSKKKKRKSFLYSRKYSRKQKKSKIK